MKYTDYGLFLGYFDHSHAIRVTADKKFDSERIRRVREVFRKCCDGFGLKDGEKTYNPSFFTCFGTIDELAVTLVSNPARFIHTAAAAPELSNFNLAFCPKLFSVAESCFDEPAEFFVEEGFDVAPLLVTCSIKFNGVLRLALGLYLQAAIAEYMCHCIDQFVSEGLETSFYTESEIAKTRCCLLDPMSADDLILVTKTSNFSVASHIISEVRNKRFRDLLHHEGEHCQRLRTELERELSDSAPDSSTLTPYREIEKLLGKKDEGTDFQLDTTFLLASTYSTFGYTNRVANSETLNWVGGKVSVRGVADVRPGMDDQALEVLERLYKGCNFAPEDQKTNLNGILAGKHDLCFSIEEDGLKYSGISVLTKDLIKGFSDFFSFENRGGKVEVCDSGLYDVISYLTVPHPQLVTHEKSNSNYAMTLRGIAENLREKFSENGQPIPEKVIDELGLSASMVGRFQRLYSEFTVAIENPLFFDAVIDLTDAFHSLRSSITQFGPKVLATIPKNRRPEFRSQMRRHLVATLEALKSSFYLRMERASAKRDEKNLRVELKGSLNNLIACADVPLKACLGLFRFTASPDRFGDYKFKQLFGGIIAAELNRRTIAKWITFESKLYATTVLIEMDIAHLFQPGLFTRIFHETGHLIFSSNICSDPSTFLSTFQMYSQGDVPIKSEVARSVVTDTGMASIEHWMTWLQEIFSELFVYATVFSGEPKRYTLNYLRDLMATIHELDAPSQVAKLEFVYRAFVVVSLGKSFDLGEDDNVSQSDFATGFVDFLVQFSRNTEQQESAIPLANAFLKDLASSEADAVGFVIDFAERQYCRVAVARKVLLPRLEKILSAYAEHRNENIKDYLGPLELRDLVEASHLNGDICLAVNSIRDEFSFVAEVLRRLAPKSNSEVVKFATPFQTLVWSSKLFWHVSTRQKFRRLVMLHAKDEVVDRLEMGE